MSPVVEDQAQTFYLICPPRVMTGGPEALHQLGAALMALGHRVFMVYATGRIEDVRTAQAANDETVVIFPDIENPVHDYYRAYNVPYTTAIVDAPRSVVIAPEIWPHYLGGFAKAGLVYWWLSLDQGVPAIERLGGLDFLRSRGVLNICQSEYASRWLERAGVAERYLIQDFTRTIVHPNPSGDRENRILYNRKGAALLQAVIERCPQFTFTLLADMTPGEVHEAMATSKIFVDFGTHPGMDRMPREAAALGCCVITNRRGSAAYFEDVPIESRYKFDTDRFDLGVFQALVQDIYDRFDRHGRAFDRYRRRIGLEQQVFSLQVQELFGARGHSS